MTCDHNCVITSLDAKWSLGSTEHWSRVWHLPSFTGLLHGVLLGDRGYPCLPYLMTPYPDPGAGPQIQFNVALSRTRVRIEMTFGILKARFSCLHDLRVTPRRASRIMTSCAVLHNIATIRKQRVPPADPLPPDVVDPITLNHLTGRAVRRALTEQFFT
ncbi:putative nuclease HARBI1 [Xyrichtys novacula]|uniref:Nuclease HARBI1 n=1 Tax=Xyrichtys novacula TaxID=13765 RepID=A0AAV1EXG8_XYRNO|nr:putative nuclease HARBI1 [Xyrichtys novacula]